MADAANVKLLVDGPRTVVVQLTSVSDGTGESAVVKIDPSTLTGAPISLAVDKIAYTTVGMSVQMHWQADTPDQLWSLPADDTNELCFRAMGGLQNPKSTGWTGDITLTTVGHSSNDSYNIVLTLHKKWGHPAWHPDSSRILEVGNLFFDTDRSGAVTRLAELPRLSGSHPSVSPDGSLYVTDGTVDQLGGPTGHWGIMVGDTRGGGAFGRADASGVYRLVNPQGKEGVAEGEFKVTISKRIMPDGKDVPEDDMTPPIDSPARENSLRLTVEAQLQCDRREAPQRIVLPHRQPELRA